MVARDFPLPVARDALLAADPLREVPPARLAATVLLLRDAAGPLEVFMLRRTPTMEFAPSMHVFPGGGVDARDDDEKLPWRGPSAAGWAQTLGTDATSARLLVVAAVREIFEETGVLLASCRGGCAGAEPVTPAAAADHACGIDPERARELRRSLVAREIALSDVLRGHDLELRSDLLTYRAHWITPVVEVRRYDTRFFAAEVPPGQEPDGDTEEADEAGWYRPADVLAACAAGEVLLLPPTQVCLEELADAGSVSRALAQPVSVGPVMPQLVLTDSGPAMRAELPEGPAGAGGRLDEPAG